MKLFAMSLLLLSTSALAAPCTHSTPREAIPTDESAIIKTVTVEGSINAPLESVFSCFTHSPLEGWFDGHRMDFVQGVTDTNLLVGPFGDEGSRRVVCLEGNDSILEEVTHVTKSANSIDFNYRIWHSTQKMAKMLGFEHADGRFIFSADGDKTKVVWTYKLGFDKVRLGQNSFAQVFHRNYMKDGLKQLGQACKRRN